MLNSLASFSGACHKRKRLGRGRSSGHGGTSTKGHKGQRARSGFGLLRGFEGGQMPLVRSLPKFGFTNKRFKKHYVTFNLSELNRFHSEVNPQILLKKGPKGAKVKILGNGELKKPLKVQAHRFSQGAILAIEKAGGSATVLDEKSLDKKPSDQTENKLEEQNNKPVLDKTD